MDGSRDTALELIQNAKNLGFLGNPMTIKCKECHAVFPREYVFCPQCDSDESFLDSSKTTTFQ